ncbi:hypothetical protein BJX62DRAFT_243772 [Aspergillus germanicus]
MYIPIFIIFITTVLAIDPAARVTLRKSGATTEPYFPPIPARCYPDPCKGITFENATAVCGDHRLGPLQLPTYFPLSTELQTYARFGDLCPYEFLAKWSYNVSNPNATYRYPYADGFKNTTENIPINGNVTLVVGQKLDRFGSEGGNFFSPLGAPYIERALPPLNLFAPENSSFPYNYHAYEVIKEFIVLLGPVTPWFEQPGLGTQIEAYNNVSYLVEKQFLRRLTLSEIDQPEDFAANYLPAPTARVAG